MSSSKSWITMAITLVLLFGADRVGCTTAQGKKDEEIPRPRVELDTVGAIEPAYERPKEQPKEKPQTEEVIQHEKPAGGPSQVEIPQAHPETGSKGNDHDTSFRDWSDWGSPTAREPSRDNGPRRPLSGSSSASSFASRESLDYKSPEALHDLESLDASPTQEHSERNSRGMSPDNWNRPFTGFGRNAQHDDRNRPFANIGRNAQRDDRSFKSFPTQEHSERNDRSMLHTYRNNHHSVDHENLYGNNTDATVIGRGASPHRHSPVSTHHREPIASPVRLDDDADWVHPLGYGVSGGAHKATESDNPGEKSLEMSNQAGSADPLSGVSDAHVENPSTTPVVPPQRAAQELSAPRRRPSFIYDEDSDEDVRSFSPVPHSFSFSSDEDIRPFSPVPQSLSSEEVRSFSPVPQSLSSEECGEHVMDTHTETTVQEPVVAGNVQPGYENVPPVAVKSEELSNDESAAPERLDDPTVNADPSASLADAASVKSDDDLEFFSARSTPSVSWHTADERSLDKREEEEPVHGEAPNHLDLDLADRLCLSDQDGLSSLSDDSTATLTAENIRQPRSKTSAQATKSPKAQKLKRRKLDLYVKTVDAEESETNSRIRSGKVQKRKKN
ncbi:hypothetical protein PAPHI01_0943 [Pancytospora philotis]|nr:hypothetical protein PAPHI01_0943 [Pancytospora philotis]